MAMSEQELMNAMLASKQESIARKASAGEDVSMFDPNAIYAGGAPVYGAGADYDLSTSVRMFNQESLLAEKASLPLANQAIPFASTTGGGLATLVGVGSALYGLYQALGGGEGEGLFGLDIFGGDSQSVGGVELGGPGLAEPSADMVEKEWHVNYDWGTLQYYLVRLASGRKKILLYNTKTKKWKAWAWRTPRLAVIGKNMPSHKMITRLRRNLKKHSADARTILRMTSPTSLASYSKKRRR